MVMILMSSLSEKYNNLLTTLETVKEEDLSLEYVRDRVLSEYERRCGEVDAELTQLFMVHCTLDKSRRAQSMGGIDLVMLLTSRAIIVKNLVILRKIVQS